MHSRCGGPRTMMHNRFTAFATCHLQHCMYPQRACFPQLISVAMNTSIQQNNKQNRLILTMTRSVSVPSCCWLENMSLQYMGMLDTLVKAQIQLLYQRQPLQRIHFSSRSSHCSLQPWPSSTLYQSFFQNPPMPRFTTTDAYHISLAQAPQT